MTGQSAAGRGASGFSQSGTSPSITRATALGQRKVNGEVVDSSTDTAHFGAVSHTAPTASEEHPRQRTSPPSEPRDCVEGNFENPIDRRPKQQLIRGPDRQAQLVAPSLDSVRSSLIRQEETIIFSLIEREQFRQNSEIYTKRTFRLNRNNVPDIYGRDASFLEYMLCETEKLHATGEIVYLVRTWIIHPCVAELSPRAVLLQLEKACARVC